MTPQELKNSILQLAFQGNLTKHLKTDSSIESLINACAADKNKAIQERKIKKERFRGAIEDDKFEVPQHWCIMYISDMSLFQEGPGILAIDFRTSGVPLIRISGMQTNRVTLDGCNYLDPDMVEDRWKHFKLEAGDILISTSASMDKVCEIYEDCSGAIPYTGQIRFKMYGDISKEYFKWFVQSPEYIRQIDEQKTGAAIKHYGPTHLKKMLIPIAPLEEQARIVAKIEELMPYIDRYEQAWNRLKNFNKRFPDDMKRSILQMAIQGKLVGQRSKEGTAEELYQQIQEEKRQLIKDGKVYREKGIKNISDDDIPFQIPKTWRWCRLGDIAKVITKGSSPSWQGVSYTDNSKNGILFVTSENVGMETMLLEKRKYVEAKFNKMHPASILQKGDILTNLVGASIGRTAIFNEDIPDANINQAVCIVRLINAALSSYVLKYMESPLAISLMLGNVVDSARANLSLTSVTNLLIPLPPILEQKRIIAKLEKILPLCERLI